MTRDHISKAAMVEFVNDKTKDFPGAHWSHLMVCDECRAALIALLKQADATSHRTPAVGDYLGG